jgi:hypothetical protein
MHKSKMIKLLKTLSKEEFKQLGKQLNNPLFAKNPLLIKLYQYLLNYFGNWESPDLGKEVVFPILYPTKDYKDVLLRKLMAEMNRHIEELLIQNHLKNQDLLKKQILQEIYGERGLYNYFEKQTNTLINHYQEKSFKDINDYLALWKLQSSYFFHPDTDKFNMEEDGILKTMEYLDAFYVLGKYKYGSEMRAREKVLKRRYDIWMLDTIKSKEHPSLLLDDSIVFQVYQSILELQELRNESIYKSIYSTLFDDQYEFEASFLLYGLQHLLNYAIWQTNQGNQAFLPEVFELYKLGLQNGLLIEKNRITDTTFTNIVAIGIRNQEYQWVEQFIFEYQHLLDPILREAVRTLCYGFLHYSRKELDKTIDLIIDFDFTNNFYYLRAKTLMLRALYEKFCTDYSLFHLFVAQSKSYEKFLRRSKTIGQYQVEVHLSFVKLLRQMVKIRYLQKWKGQAHNKLIERLTQTAQIANKEWLLQKLKDR